MTNNLSEYLQHITIPTSSKIINAIHSRIHDSFGEDLDDLYDIETNIIIPMAEVGLFNDEEVEKDIENSYFIEAVLNDNFSLNIDLIKEVHVSYFNKVIHVEIQCNYQCLLSYLDKFEKVSFHSCYEGLCINMSNDTENHVTWVVKNWSDRSKIFEWVLHLNVPTLIIEILIDYAKTNFRNEYTSDEQLNNITLEIETEGIIGSSKLFGDPYQEVHGNKVHYFVDKKLIIELGKAVDHKMEIKLNNKQMRDLLGSIDGKLFS